MRTIATDYIFLGNNSSFYIQCDSSSHLAKIPSSLACNCSAYKLCDYLKANRCIQPCRSKRSSSHIVLTSITTEKEFSGIIWHLFSENLELISCIKNIVSISWNDGIIWYQEQCCLLLPLNLLQKYDVLHHIIMPVHSEFSTFRYLLVCRWKRLHAGSHNIIEHVFLFCSRHIFCSKVTNYF